MNFSKPAVLLLALSAPCAVAGDTIDISGLQSWGLDGDPDNETGIFFPGPLDPDLGYIILRIDYDITIQTFGLSKFSELNIRFGNSNGTFHGSWPDTFVPGQSDSSGIQRFTGSFSTDIHLNEDGEFHVELFEGIWDDNPGQVDAVLLPGSTMTFGRFIPAPGGVSMLAIGALTVGSRRRR